MKNDLSGVKVGDWIWTIRDGWTKVKCRVKDTHIGYPVETESEQYTVDGKYVSDDTYPSAFLEPPECFCETEPKPCEFKKGQRVLVWEPGHKKHRRYFSHLGDGGLFHCFPNGYDGWAYEGTDTIGWKCCEAWNEA